MKVNSIKIFQYARRIPEIYGTFIALGLIFYFFIAYFAGFLHVIEYRLLNLVIMSIGIYYSLKQFKRTHSGNLDYFKALIIGVSSAFIGTSTFVLFLFLYLKIDTALMQAIIENEPMGPYLNTYIATFAVWLEGIFSGLIMTFILINFLTDQKE
ncbi:hypothetical protein [Chryseolinea sp. H1M3-3]|uniref:hypothetical protein n=1 Tax=Chryseolinea sp. H1M3-3 TaxID=3034144 RepID=UPI0023ED2E69|nr:hypothetical protein [Chryseolinea sp. H1M3-3]